MGTRGARAKGIRVARELRARRALPFALARRREGRVGRPDYLPLLFGDEGFRLRARGAWDGNGVRNPALCCRGRVCAFAVMAVQASVGQLCCSM